MIRMISAPYSTPTGKVIVYHLTISKEDYDKGLRMLNSNGRPNQRFVTKRLVYKSLERAKKERDKAVKKAWQAFSILGRTHN